MAGYGHETDRNLRRMQLSATESDDHPDGFLPSTEHPSYSDVRQYHVELLEEFESVRWHTMNNTLAFATVSQFMSYYEATALYEGSSKHVPMLRRRMRKKAEEVLDENGSIKVTKVIELAEYRI